MAFNEKNLARQSVDTTAETIYTVAADTIGIIKDIHVCNNNESGADKYFTLWLVPDGASPTDENILFYRWNIRTNDIAHWNGWQILSPGDTIQALAETANEITITISGGEIT